MGKKMRAEAKKDLKKEGLSEEEADKALDMFEKGDKEGLMKMKKEHDKKKGGDKKGGDKKGSDDKEKELVEKKKGKKLAEKKKGKKLVTLSEESDEESMEKAMKEWEAADEEGKNSENTVLMTKTAISLTKPSKKV